MDKQDHKLLNQTILALFPRAEKYSEFHLENSFVDIANLSTLLSIPVNQIIYGRRGTGKTHLFTYQSFKLKQKGAMTVNIDLRTVGSNGGIYGDKKTSLNERASALTRDVLIYTINEFLNYVLYTKKEEVVLEDFEEIYEQLHQAINQIEIVGTLQSNQNEKHIELNENQESKEKTTGNIIKGRPYNRISFPSINKLFNKLIEIMKIDSIFIFLDEWSEIPIELQPYLADLLRRTLFPIKKISLKIAAIQYRSNFIIQKDSHSYIGLELGSDIATSIDLDELVVFENNFDTSRDFFSRFIFNHITNQGYNNDILQKYRITTSKELIDIMFSDQDAFDEIIKASEGNPRDAIQILQESAMKANGFKISQEHIREGARQFFNKSKEYNVRAREDAYPFLQWIIRSVIKERGVRAFLLGASRRNELIDFLYSNRVLHIIKSGIIDLDNPDRRYRVYAIDYGCYIDLLRADKAPQGLLSYKNERNNVKYIKVLENQYGPLVLERAVLKLEEYRKSMNK
ncbi:hypothetical protein ABN763_04375 [Spongiivirga sp. MCCC 1A20706]|uniref:hypothetical protein n=1 Tax=Spongiivirga sp. MCCC 1A20706 TaxID=3160963 RepID=UPI0039774A79